jgi:hypothetical protein
MATEAEDRARRALTAWEAALTDAATPQEVSAMLASAFCVMDEIVRRTDGGEQAWLREIREMLALKGFVMIRSVYADEAEDADIVHGLRGDKPPSRYLK